MAAQQRDKASSTAHPSFAHDQRFHHNFIHPATWAYLLHTLLYLPGCRGLTDSAGRHLGPSLRTPRCLATLQVIDPPRRETLIRPDTHHFDFENEEAPLLVLSTPNESCD